MDCPDCGEEHEAFCPRSGRAISPPVAPVESLPPPGGHDPRPAGAAPLVARAAAIYASRLLPAIAVAALFLAPVGALAQAIRAATAPRAAAVSAELTAIDADMRRQTDEYNARRKQLQATAHVGLRDELYKLDREYLRQRAAQQALFAQKANAPLVSLLGALVLSLLLAPLQGAAAFLAMGALVPLASDARSVAEALGALRPRLAALAGAGALSGVLLVLGLWLCVIPGAIAATFFSVAPAVAMLEPHRGIPALRRSVALVRPRWGRALALVVGYAAVVLIVDLAAGRVAPAAAPWITELVSLLAFPLLGFSLVLLHREAVNTAS